MSTKPTTSRKDGSAQNSRIAENKRALFNYHIDERFEAGMVLEGWEVKSVRAGKVQLTDGYVVIKNGELFIIGCQINPLGTASTHVRPDSVRTKKLLMHKDEIRAKRLHPGATEPALEGGPRQMRGGAGQGQGRTRQARHDQGARGQARSRAGDEVTPALKRAAKACRSA
jgi:hypothetical protein